LRVNSGSCEVSFFEYNPSAQKTNLYFNGLKMKKSLGIALSSLVLLLSGCSTNSPVSGGLYTGVTHSGVSTGGIKNSSVTDLKKGTSSCISVLGLIATGDCSEDTARKNGGITKVHSVYHESTSVYIFFNKYETIVTGE
jgi:hypothetical protein